MVPAPELDPRHGERRLLTGRGLMNGRQVATAIFDSSIAAGSVTIATGKKLIAHMQQAEAQRCPLLIDWDSGGADIPEGVASLDIFRQIFTQINEISGRIPTLSILSGLNAGGGAYAPVMTDTVIMIDGSMMAVTGPAVIRVATGEVVTPDEMGGGPVARRKIGGSPLPGGRLPGGGPVDSAVFELSPRKYVGFSAPDGSPGQNGGAHEFASHCDPCPDQRSA